MRSKFKWIYALLVALTMQFSFAQDKTVTGTVSDDLGVLPGVNVLVKGTTRRVTTDFDGKFSIKAKEGEVLVFSFVEKGNTEKTVGAGNTINVSMKSNNILNEVIVGAVGIKKKKAAVTSSYAVVSNEELKAASNPDVVRSLVGKISGITINGTSNGVNGTNSIRIRSMLSLTGNTEALVVIDNVISNADVFAQLPSDVVESVTVLKGAQGAALYGSQGKQGVVLVQTKKGGKNEKLSISFNSSVDFESINFVPQKQQKYGQGWYSVRDPQENGGWGPLFDGTVGQVGLPDANGNIITAPYSSRGDDNIKDFYQTGTIYQNNINVSMGGADSFINVNLSNLRRAFILDGDKLNRNSFLLTAGKKFNKLTIGGTFTFTNQKTEQADVYAATSRGDYTLLTTLLQGASNIPIKDFKDRGIYGWNGYYQNPWWAKDNNRLDETRNFVNLGLNADYAFNKNFSLGYNASAQQTSVTQFSFANALTSPSFSDGDFSSPSNFFSSALNQTYVYADFLAKLNFELTNKIGLSATVGQNFQYSGNNRISQGGSNLEIPFFYNITNVLNPALPSSLTNRKTISKITASFASVDLNYSNYLFLNLTARYEGNSVAQKGNQFYFYPSAGLSFVPNKVIEGLKDSKIVSNIKLYGNYTKIGSLDPVAAYEILSLAGSAANFPFSNTGNSFSNLTSITDPAIRPEMYTTYEGGVNLGFFNNKLTIDASAYITDTDDLITDASVSTTTGILNKKTNNGKLRGQGYEIDLGFAPFKGKDFSWSGRVSLSKFETKVIDLGGTDKVTLFDVGDSGSQIDGDISAVTGLNFPYITGTDWIKDSQGRVIVSNQGRPTPDSRFQNLGQVNPDYVVGVFNTFEYKGIGLSFTMDYRKGGNFLSQTKYNLTWNGHLYESAEFDRNVGFLFPNSVIDDPSTVAVDYIPNTNVLTGGFYTQTGQNNRTQAYYGQASNLGAFNMIDATALKIREIALSYTIPSKLIERTGLKSFKFSLNARNPFIFLAEGNRGYADPEASSQFNRSTGSAARNAGGTRSNTSLNGIGFIGDAQYPSTRTFGFSINATF